MQSNRFLENKKLHYDPVQMLAGICWLIKRNLSRSQVDLSVFIPQKSECLGKEVKFSQKTVLSIKLELTKWFENVVNKSGNWFTAKKDQDSTG